MRQRSAQKKLWPDSPLASTNESPPRPVPAAAFETPGRSDSTRSIPSQYGSEIPMVVRCGTRLLCNALRPLWAAVMHELLRSDHPISPPGEALVKREICAATGLLPSRFSPSTITELFCRRGFRRTPFPLCHLPVSLLCELPPGLRKSHRFHHDEIAGSRLITRTGGRPRPINAESAAPY